MNKTRLALITLLLSSLTITQAWAAMPPELGRIGVIQYDPSTFGDLAAERIKLERLALGAIQDGAQVVLMPEGAQDGYFADDGKKVTTIWCKPGMKHFKHSWGEADCSDVEKIAQTPRQGESLAAWERFAIEHRVHLVLGTPEKSKDQYFSSAFVFGPEGYVGVFHKNFLWWMDMGYATPGQHGLVIEAAGAKYGLLICADAHYSGNLYSEYRAAKVDGVLAIGAGISTPHFGAKLSGSGLKGFFADMWSSGYIGRDASFRESMPENHYGYGVFDLSGALVKSYDGGKGLSVLDANRVRFYQIYE